MSWIQTFTGIAFDLAAPTPAQVDPIDIAHALSNICRYNGHTREHFSVAEHCCHMHDWFQGQGNHEAAAGALFHDAAEAYLGDLASPVKRVLPPAALEAWKHLEDGINGAIAAKAGIPVTLFHRDDVKEADLAILHEERAAFLGPEARPWGLPAQAMEGFLRRPGWPPYYARTQWLKRAAECAPGFAYLRELVPILGAWQPQGKVGFPSSYRLRCGQSAWDPRGAVVLEIWQVPRLSWAWECWPYPFGSGGREHPHFGEGKGDSFATVWLAASYHALEVNRQINPKKETPP